MISLIKQYYKLKMRHSIPLLTFGFITPVITVLHAIAPPGHGDALGLGYARPLKLATIQWSHRTILPKVKYEKSKYASMLAHSCSTLLKFPFCFRGIFALHAPFHPSHLCSLDLHRRSTPALDTPCSEGSDVWWCTPAQWCSSVRPSGPSNLDDHRNASQRTRTGHWYI